MLIQFLLRLHRAAAVLSGFIALAGIASAAGDVRWLKISTPEFVVITPLGETAGRAWAAEFSQYIAAMRSVLKQSEGALPPLTVVVFARKDEFEDYQPLSADGSSQPVAGFFLRAQSWSVAGLDGQFADQSRRTIFHEGVHWILSTAQRKNPVWIEEGLAEVFSTFRIVDDNAEWGHPITEHIAALRGLGMMSLENLLFTGHEELFGKDVLHTGIVYAQSWAFAHYLTFGKHNIPPNALGQYALLSATLPPAEAFRRAFGADYQEIDRQLREYVASGQYYVRRRTLADFNSPRLTNASDVDVEVALARLAWAGRRWEQAAQHARRAIAAAKDDPRGHEMLGMAFRGSGDLRGAESEYQRAVGLGSKDAVSHFELAGIEIASAEAGDREKSPQLARQIANRYEAAINLDPRFQMAYENLGGIIGAADPISAEDRRFLEQGLQLWPENRMIQGGLAMLSRREGMRSAARNRDEQEDRGDTVAVVVDLIAAKKFAQADSIIEARLARGADEPIRSQLLSAQRTARQSLVVQQIELAMENQNWVDARKYLGELAESEAPTAMKNWGKRQLANLDRKGLGL